MTLRQVYDLALREYWLGLYPTPEERLAAALEVLTEAFGRISVVPVVHLLTLKDEPRF